MLSKPKFLNAKFLKIWYPNKALNLEARNIIVSTMYNHMCQVIFELVLSLPLCCSKSNLVHNFTYEDDPAHYLKQPLIEFIDRENKVQHSWKKKKKSNICILMWYFQTTAFFNQQIQLSTKMHHIKLPSGQ